MIVVIGEILIDNFPDYRRIGGAPFNFAFHLKKLGFDVRLISRVGDDQDGRSIMAMLTENGFDAGDIQVDPRHPTGTVDVALDEDGVPQFDIRRDVAYDYLDLGGDTVTDGGEARMIYYGTLAQRTDAARRNVHDFLNRQGKGGLRFCDINMRPPHINRQAVAESLRQADLLKLNDEELTQIRREFDGPPADDARIPWLMEKFAIRAVALTSGAQGSTFVHDGSSIRSPAMEKTTIIDTVGAGDGYAAILAAGYFCRIPWEETIVQATRFASRICGIPGAVPESEAFYDEFRAFTKGRVNGH